MSALFRVLLYALLGGGLRSLPGRRGSARLAAVLALGLDLAWSLHAGVALWMLPFRLPAAAVGAALGWWIAPRFWPGARADPHFDLLAPWYERLIHPRQPEKLLALLELTPQARVLDVGGGTGRVAQFLRPARLVVVADLSPVMLRFAAAKDGLQTACALAEQLPFPNGAFDRVLIVDALHHVFRQEAALAELWRVLAPGGRLLIEEPDADRWLGKAVAVMEKMMLMRSRFLTADQIVARLPAGAQARVQRHKMMVRVVATKSFAGREGAQSAVAPARVGSSPL